MINRNIAKILKSAFEKRKQENSRFSLGLLALKLNISKSFASLILSGKRALPPELATDFCKLLKLDIEQRDLILRGVLLSRKLPENKGLLSGIRPKRNSQNDGRKRKWVDPNDSHFWILREWYYFAILDSTLLKGFDGSANFIATALGLDLETTRAAIKKLQGSGFLELVSGKLVKSNKLNAFNSIDAKNDLRAYHSASIEIAKETMASRAKLEDLEKRLITTGTVTVAKEKVVWAKQQIAEFLCSLIEQLSEDELPDDVYQISIQFLPLTNR